MRNKIRIFALAFIFSTMFMPVLNATAQKVPGLLDSMATISMDFKDANLKDVLKMLSIQSGLNFIASESVSDRKVTLYLDKVPVQEAMDELFKANNLSYDLNPDNNIFIVKDWGKMKVDLVTKVFYLRHCPVSTSALKTEVSGKVGSTAFGSGLIDSVKKVLSENGSVVEDSRTNSIIVTDIPSRMPMVEETIKALDVPVPQVMLEVEMLDVNKKLTEQMGIKYANSIATFTLGPATAAAAQQVGWGAPLGAWGKMSRLGQGPASTIGYTSTFSAQIDFLKTQTDTKYLARPRLLTLNNETAEIKITTQEVIGYTQTASTGSGSTASPAVNAERQETGVTLRVTPQIDAATGEITMFIFPTVKDSQRSSFSVPTTGSVSGSFYDPEERSTKSTVRVKDGDTVVVAGLIRYEKNIVETKLPFLGDIPFFGTFFRHKDVSKDKERELLVFITPHIIKQSTTGANIGQGKKPVVPMREQSQVPVEDRKRLAVGSSLREFEARTP